MDLLEICTAFVEDIMYGSDLSSDNLNIVRRNVFSLLSDLFNEKSCTHYKSEVFSYIASDSAIVEIIDEETKLCFRRELPLRYEETGNGVSLIGEDISGKNSQISFLSETAYTKINELTGKGADSPKCGGHGV